MQDLFGIAAVSGEKVGAGLFKIHLQGLVTGCVPRSKPDFQGTIAKEIVTIIRLTVEEQPVHLFIKISPDIGRFLVKIGDIGPLQLFALYYIGCIGKGTYPPA